MAAVLKRRHPSFDKPPPPSARDSPRERISDARTTGDFVMLKTVCIGLAALLGVAAAANGLFMLASPGGWYLAVPGVTTTGAYNQHFIRDIGLIFVFMGLAFMIGAAKPHLRLFLWGSSTLWLSCHALFHVWEVLVGICGPSALVRDFGAVTFPAILGWGLTIWAALDDRDAVAGA
jgi:hypothetical protein